jgi:hypothetical protein
MNDKTKKYLDKVIEFIVEDTIIDYDLDRIIFPLSPPTYTPSHLFLTLPYPYFEKYCKDTYGLTNPEIKYVWIRYKNIMLNKINER